MNLKGGTNVTEELRAIVVNMCPDDTVTVPPGEYLVDVNALKPKARTTFNLQGAVFRVVPNDLAHYAVIEIRTEGVTINGGYFIGDKDEHRGSKGQWGFGIKIGKGALDTVLRDVRCDKMWGDGFYVGGGEGVIILDCVAEKNRRQGLSIVHGKNIRVHGCTFSNTSGTAPMAGIDVEPDKVDRGVLDVVISHCKLIGNQGYGIVVNDRKGPVRKLKVGACYYRDNKKGALKARGAWSWYQKFVFDRGWFRPKSVVMA